MPTTPLDNTDLTKLVDQFELEVGAGVTLLPRVLEAEFGCSGKLVHSPDATTLVKVLRQADVPAQVGMPKRGTVPSLVQRSADWFGPTLFVSAMYLSQNPDAVSLALGVLGNYLTDVFRGREDRTTVKFSLFVESQHGLRGVKYEGPIAGIRELKDLFRDSP